MRLFPVLLLAFASSLCAQTSQKVVTRPAPAIYATPDLDKLIGPRPADLRAIIDWYAADERNLNLFYDVEFSPSRLKTLGMYYNTWLTAIDKLNFNEFGPGARIDYVLFRTRIQRSLQQLTYDQQRFIEMQQLMPFALTIVELKDARQRVDPLDPQKAAATVSALSKQLDESTKWVRNSDTKTSRTVGRRAAQTVSQIRSYLDQWYKFYNGYEPLFGWWVTEPYKKLDKGLEAYAALLKEKVAGLKKDDKDTILGDPIGREALLSELRAEYVPYTPEELVEIANKEFAWCEKEMLRASNDLGYGNDWKQALEHVKNLYVAPGRQTALVMELATEAADYMTKNDLLTIPPLAMDTWRMQMMTPEAQRLNPFFLGGESIIVSYPTDTMTHEEKLMSMRGNNPYFSRATVQHELIPGHRLQFYMTSRYKPYRREFSTPFWTEGWALYWELQLWDRGFPRSPEDRIGMLFWRMHRCARIIFSLSFHLGKMTAQESVDFLVNKVGHEYENAAGEVRRSFESRYSPLYQSAYLLGGIQFRALHREMVASGKMTNRAFHDLILQSGSMPVEMVRATVTGQTINKDFSTQWKFYQGF